MEPETFIVKLGFEQVFFLVLTVAGLVMLAMTWRLGRRRPLDRAQKTVLLLGIGLLPLLLWGFGTNEVLERSKSNDSCVSCHLMEPYGRNMTAKGSESLAARHWQNNRLGEHGCYTCHSSYGVFGGVEAKMAGTRHLWKYLTTSYELPLEVSDDTPHESCLTCHLGTPVFEGVELHMDPSTLEPLRSGEMTCIDCHAPPHPDFTEEDYEEASS